jgi:ferredoxin-NADP reductase
LKSQKSSIDFQDLFAKTDSPYTRCRASVRQALLGRLSWQLGEVVATQQETMRTKRITLALPTWRGHQAGQHMDVRLTAQDGYQAERSYSIASPPEKEHRLTLTVERLDDGEVSPYLTEELRAGDQLELRGPIGGYFVWEESMGGPLLLVAGGSGIVPLMAMLRNRAAVGSTAPTRLLYSSRSDADIIYRNELERLDEADQMLEVVHTLTRAQPPGWTGYHRRIETDRNAIASGAASNGSPGRYYDLGHGWCSYEFFDQCPHRMACARCDFYVPKASERGRWVETRGGLLKMLQEIHLSDEERAAVDGDVQALDRLLERLATVPTPSGSLPGELTGTFIPLKTLQASHRGSSS